MNQRLSALITLTLFGTLAQAQVSVQSVLDSLQVRRLQPNLFVRMVGTQVVQGRATDFTTDIFWSGATINDPLDKVEVREYRTDPIQQKEILIKRMVADGDIFYAYNLQTREFSQTPYGRFDGKTSLTYRRDLLLYLKTLVSGPSTHAMRLIDEIYGGLAASHDDWLPGSELQIQPLSLDYTLRGVKEKSLQFQFGSNNGQLELKFLIYRSITFGDLNNNLRWMMTILAVSPNPSNFTPYPAAQLIGWRPIIGPRSLGE